MDFYCVKGKHELGKEPLGTADKFILRNRTQRTALKHARDAFGDNFTLWSFINIYDNDTFQKIV